MRSTFFRSKEFWIAAALAGIVLAGATAAFASSLDPETRVRSSSCGRTASVGFAAIADRTDTGPVSENGHVRRTVTYTLNASALPNGSADFCVSYGDVAIRPSADGKARVIFTINSWGFAEEAVRQTKVEAVSRASAGALEIQAWQANHAETSYLFSDSGASVDIALELPESTIWRLAGETRYGDVSVVRLPVSGKVETKYGDLDVLDVTLSGSMSILTRYGDVGVRVLDFGGGRLAVDSEYGEVDVRLPRRAEVGYDVTAETKYGDAEVDIGETEHFDVNRDRDTIRARSAGYAAKPIKLEVAAATSYGDVTVKAG